METPKLYKVEEMSFSVASNSYVIDQVYVYTENVDELLKKWNQVMPEDMAITVPSIFENDSSWSVRQRYIGGSVISDRSLEEISDIENWLPVENMSSFRWFHSETYPRSMNIVVINNDNSLSYFVSWPYVFRMFQQPQDSKHSEIVYVETSIDYIDNNFVSRQNIDTSIQLGQATRQDIDLLRKGKNMFGRKKSPGDKPSLTVLYLNGSCDKYKEPN